MTKWYKKIINVKDCGAAGNGTTDDTVAIELALKIVNFLGGGTIYFPASSGAYVISRTIELSSLHGVRIIGDGWSTKAVGGAFGDGGWPTAVRGSVIRSTMTADAIQAKSTATEANDYTIEHIAFVGPGIGGEYYGLNTIVPPDSGFSGTQSLMTDDVLFANYPTGMGLYLQESTFRKLTLLACNVGATITRSTTISFFDIIVSNCTTGVLVDACETLSFVGGAFEGNPGQIGLHLKTGAQIRVADIYFEMGTGTVEPGAISFDTSGVNATNDRYIEWVELENVRFGSWSMVFTTNNAFLNIAPVIGITMINCDHPAPITWPAWVMTTVLINNKWGGFTDNSSGMFRLAENITPGASYASNLKNLQIFDNGIGGYQGPLLLASTRVGLTSGATTLTSEADHPTIIFTGALTGDCTIQFPVSPYPVEWTLDFTAAAFNSHTIHLQTGAGAKAISVTTESVLRLYSDGISSLRALIYT
jgi:Pectate lyase superfamily protein